MFVVYPASAPANTLIVSVRINAGQAQHWTTFLTPKLWSQPAYKYLVIPDISVLPI